ncbi:MAG: hypothetical protein F4039_08970 [Gammaproteobacteria bacterium]|nr:hypothetical protein [Gammaproteobacteria bacterium]MYK44201.1 hypothetical protein [Gammaproteobacteria bacterium]
MAVTTFAKSESNLYAHIPVQEYETAKESCEKALAIINNLGILLNSDQQVREYLERTIGKGSIDKAVGYIGKVGEFLELSHFNSDSNG